nr:hypothetical protein [Tanacetum cinerariifolium]
MPCWQSYKRSLVEGTKGKDIDVYMRPLIDDLKDLWAKPGVKTIDVATGQKFNMRAMVLWSINDFLARSSLSGWSGQGYKACPTCNKDTPSMHNDPRVNKSNELFALACGPSHTPISVNSCVVNDVRFVVHSHDERRTTQNNGICSPSPDEEMYYGQLEQILEFSYLSFKTVLFRVKWFDTSNKGYMARRPPGWKVVEQVSHKKFSNGGVIVVEYDPHVIHVDNSSDLTLSTSLNEMEITGLHIDGQSIDVDVPPDIIDVVDEDDDITDEEAPIPYDLAGFDDEDLMSADVAWGHGGDCGGDDRPPSYYVPTGCEGFLGNRGKGTRKPNLGGRRASKLHTHQETRNLRLKAIMDKSGPVLIWFKVDDRETLKPLGDHMAHWANYLRELVRELPLHYPSWRQMPPERKAGTQFDLHPHMKSDRWPQIYTSIQQHLQKIYNGKKADLEERYWVPEEDGTYDLERIRQGRPSCISKVDWDLHFAFWNDPKNLAWGAQINETGQRARSYTDRDPGQGTVIPPPSLSTHSADIARLKKSEKLLTKQVKHVPEMETSATREYPSLIHTFFLTHTVGSVFLNPEDKALYGLGSNTPIGQGTIIPPPSQSTHSADIARLKKSEKWLTKQVNMFMRLFRSNKKFYQMLSQLELQPGYGGGRRSGGCEDDEP